MARMRGLAIAGVLLFLLANLAAMASIRNQGQMLEAGSAESLLPAVVGLIAAAALYLGFLPPASYRHWGLARAAARQAAI